MLACPDWAFRSICQSLGMLRLYQVLPFAVNTGSLHIMAFATFAGQLASKVQIPLPQTCWVQSSPSLARLDALQKTVKTKTSTRVVTSKRVPDPSASDMLGSEFSFPR